MRNSQMRIDDTKCYEVVRHLRWTVGVRWPPCGSQQVRKRGAVMTSKQIVSDSAAQDVVANAMI